MEVLQNGKIAGAGLDAVDPEPMKENDPLLHLKNVGKFHIFTLKIPTPRYE